MIRSEVEIKQIIKKYLDYLSNELKIQRVILYGSYAKGTATEDSDIDIAIESQEFDDNDLEVCKKLQKAVWRSGIDPILEPRPIHNVLQPFFVEEILKIGKVMYTAE